MNSKQLSIKLSLIYIATYAALSSFLPFLTPYLQNRGLSFTQIGIVFAVNSIVAVLFQPIWGFLTDKYLNKRVTIIILSIVCSFLIYNFIFAQSFIYIVISIILLISFQSSIFPISDAYTYEIIHSYKEIQFGRVRLMGSIGYATGALMIGYVIKQFGVNTPYFIYSVLMLAGALLFYTIDFNKESGSIRKVSFSDFGELIKDNRFSIFMISIVFVNITMGMNSTYISLLIEKTGGDVSNLGLLWFAVAISELPTFFFGAKILKRFGELNIFILGVFLFSVRLMLNSIAPSFGYVIVIQLMQGITFAFYLLAAMQYINTITPEKIKTSAMTFFAAMCGFGALICNLGGVLILEHITIFSLYRISSLVCLFSLVFVMVLKRQEEARKIKLEMEQKLTLEPTIV